MKGSLFFYFIGHIGIIIYILIGALEIGKRLDVLVQYFRDNALAIILSWFCYTGLVLVWYYSNALTLFGMDQGQLSALTIFVAYSSNSIFTKIARKYTGKEEANGEHQADPPAPEKP